MNQKLTNRLRNGDFSLGQRGPVGWRWLVIDGQAARSFGRGRHRGQRSLCVELGEGGGAGGIWQRISCRRGQSYRVELVGRSDSNVTGVGVRVGWRAENRCLHELSWRVDLSVDEWTLWRQYVDRPAGAEELELQIGVCGRGGRCWLDAVRVIPVEEREESSHVLAAVPPPLAYPSPVCAKRVIVYGPAGSDSKLVDWLARRLGSQAASWRSLAQLRRGPGADEAIFVEDGPWAGASLEQLEQWGGQGLAIASLGAFARAVNGRGRDVVRTRVVRQQLAPPAGRVVWANFITRGFALWDVLPYCWEPDADGWFCQRQIVMTRGLKRLLAAEGFQIVLSSEGEFDRTSEHPLVLYRADGRGGGVLVMDAWLASSSSSNLAENEPAAALLLNALGRRQVSLGQYVVPAAKRRDATSEVWELVKRFEVVAASGSRNRPLVRLWGPERAAPEKRVLLRTGYDPRQWVGFYSVLVWLRSLARDVQMGGPGREVARRVHLVWDALADDGGQDSQDGSFDAVIDVCGERQDGASVAVHRGPTWLGRCGGHVADVLRGLGHDGPDIAWRSARRVAHDKCGQRFPRVDSGTWLTIHLPDCGDSGLHRSMESTELGASLVEQAVGAQIGLIAANRTSDARQMRIRRGLYLSGGYELFDQDGHLAGSGKLGAGGLRRALHPGWLLLVDGDRRRTTRS